ncbi:TPA: hypothetical protein ACSCYS_003519 [Aeromonas veronii]
MNHISTHAEKNAETVLMQCEIFFAKDSSGHVQPPVASTMAISSSTTFEMDAPAPVQEMAPVAIQPSPARNRVQPTITQVESSIAAAPASAKAATSIASMVPTFITQATLTKKKASGSKPKKEPKAPRVKKVTSEQSDSTRDANFKPRVPYNPKARNRRMRSILLTIVEMAGDNTEITVNKIKARMEEELLPQIKSGALKVESIGADINTAMKIMGGMVELRRDPSPRGRPYAVYAFDASMLTERGKEIHSAIYLEGGKSK